MSLNYKHKYQQLKQTFLSSVQNSYKLGFEAGLTQAQTQQAQQSAQDAQAQIQALQNPQQVDENGQPIASQDQGQQVSQDQFSQSGQEEQPMEEGQGSELDGHINELSNLVQKGAKPSLPELRQKLEQIQDLRKSQKQKAPPAKKIESSQKQLLNSILKSWKEESPKISNNIADIIAEAESKVK